MSDLIAVAVVDLKAGPALDWSVAKATDTCVELTMEFASQSDGSQMSGLVPWVIGARKPFKPSVDWAQCGPLIGYHKGDIISFQDNQHLLPDGHRYLGRVGELHNRHSHSGATALEAFCKALVQSKFGDAVSVPKALWGGA